MRLLLIQIQNTIWPSEITISVRLGQVATVVLKLRQFVLPWFPYITVLSQESSEFISLFRLFRYISNNDRNPL